MKALRALFLLAIAPAALGAQTTDTTITRTTPEKQSACRKAVATVYIIDDRVSTCEALNALTPTQIKTVEVLKGNAAELIYRLPRGTTVIVVKTRLIRI